MDDFRYLSIEEVEKLLTEEDFTADNEDLMELSLNPDERHRYVIRPRNMKPIESFVNSDPHPRIQRNARLLIENSEGIEDPWSSSVREVSRLLNLISEESDDIKAHNSNRYSFDMEDFDHFMDYSKLFYFDRCLDVIDNPDSSSMSNFPEEYRLMDQDLKDIYWSALEIDGSPHGGTEEFSYPIPTSIETDRDKLSKYFLRTNLITQSGKLKASDEEIELAKKALTYYEE